MTHSNFMETPKITQKVLEQLEWPFIAARLAGYCHFEESRKRCFELIPNKKFEEISNRWSATLPLKKLLEQGYTPPLQDTLNLRPIFRALNIGQMLYGADLKEIERLLHNTRNAHHFANDFESRCTSLRRFKTHLYPLPHLIKQIEAAIDSEGHIKDEASLELKKLRESKVYLKQRIEKQIKQLLSDTDITPYLQDDFFTVRNERYVVPIRLDGRGRIKGSIIDTSDSGQTLFIEPQQIIQMNDSLLDIELSEKIEIARILKEINAAAQKELPEITTNYEELDYLDSLTAEAKLALELNATSVKLSPTPTLQLQKAYHPIVYLQLKEETVANDISLEENQRSLVITGPNAGGKTVILKTVGLIHLMAEAGLLLPCDENSLLFPFTQIFSEIGDAQNITASLSTFAGHLLGLKKIVTDLKTSDLVLIDEIASGTEPQTGAALAQAYLEELNKKNAITLVSTHFDELKTLANSDKNFRNGSMSYSLENQKPTYQLLLDLPGRSYGLEIASKLGLPLTIVERAKKLRGGIKTQLDIAIDEFTIAREQVEKEKEITRKERLEAEAARDRWTQESAMLDDLRRSTSQKLLNKYENEFSMVRDEFSQALARVKELERKLARAEITGSDQKQMISDNKQAIEISTKKYQQLLTGLQETNKGLEQNLPGKICEFKTLKIGMKVYIIPLKKNGVIAKIGDNAEEPIEVQMGLIKMRVLLHDLRSLEGSTQK